MNPQSGRVPFQNREDNLSSRIINHDQSEIFGILSGDFNPQHLDPIHARRLPFGYTVCHGIHTILTAIDLFAEQESVYFALEKIRASFVSPLYQGAVIEINIEQNDNDVFLLIHSEERTIASVRMTVRKLDRKSFSVATKSVFEWSKPAHFDHRSFENVRGHVDLVFDKDLASSLLPSLANYMDGNQVAALLAATRIVGMNCPGERSIFKYFYFTFGDTNQEKSLEYSLERFDQKTSMASISVNGSWMRGNIHAMLRAEPVKQISFLDALISVEPNAFTRQHILVVGGSRGMGEVAAKLTAAGGAHVTVGYATGIHEAEQVVIDITDGGGSAAYCKLDVKTGEFMLNGCEPVTHLYYFASPKIILKDVQATDFKLLNKYIEYYLKGLESILIELKVKEILQDNLTILLPSTIFIDHPHVGAFEYAAAKAVSEVYVSYCASKLKINVNFLTPRLPMVRTDQTSNVNANLPSAAEVLLPLLPRTEEQQKSCVSKDQS